MIKTELNLGMRGHDLNAESIEELASKLNSYGLKSVQLVLKKSIKDFSEGMFSPAYAKQIGDAFSKNNVDIAVLGCYINPSCTDENKLKAETEYFVENLKYARYMNAGVVGLETGFVGDTCNPENNHTEKAYQHLLTTMKYIRDNAEKVGVTIAVEAVSCFVINTPEKMLRLVNDLNSPNIAVIFDLLNVLTIDNYQSQEKIIDTAFELLGDKIAVVHLKDFIAEDGGLKQCEIGKGICDIPYLLSVIKHKKPNLPIILEETRENVLSDIVRFVTEVL